MTSSGNHDLISAPSSNLLEANFLLALFVLASNLRPTAGVVPKPTDFQYAQINVDENILTWEWNYTEGALPDRVTFSVQYCSGMNCWRNSSIAETTLRAKNLIPNRTYKVRIVAIVLETNGSEAFSEPMIDAMQTLAMGWSPPKDVQAVRVAGTESPTEALYLIGWKLPPVPQLRFVTVSACDSASTNGSCLTQTAVRYQTNLTLSLSYNKFYQLMVYSVYDVGLNLTVVRVQDTTLLPTGVGPPGPVRNLAVSLNKVVGLVQMSWDTPEFPNGPQVFYAVNVTFANGTDFLPPAVVSSTVYEVRFDVDAAKGIDEFELWVTPVNFYGKQRLYGGAVGVVVYHGKQAEPPRWLSILVALLVLALSLWRSFSIRFFILN